MQYPCKIKPDTAGYVVSFRDIPEALTEGETIAEAQSEANDALLSALEIYFDERRIVPAPTKPKRGEYVITLPTTVAAKIALHNEMAGSQKKRTELARELSMVPSAIDRLLDIRHSTRIETLEQALAIFGRRLEVMVV